MESAHPGQQRQKLNAHTCILVAAGCDSELLSVVAGRDAQIFRPKCRRDYQNAYERNHIPVITRLTLGPSLIISNGWFSFFPFMMRIRMCWATLTNISTNHCDNFSVGSDVTLGFYFFIGGCNVALGVTNYNAGSGSPAKRKAGHGHSPA